MAKVGMELLYDNAAIKEVTHEVSSALKSAKWLAGQPLAVDANGLKAITINATTGACDVVCVATKSYRHYKTSQEQIEGTVPSDLEVDLIETIKGHFQCWLGGDSVDGSAATTYPFLQTPSGGSWTVGDLVYISDSDATASGKWDDTAAGTDDKAYGRVWDIEGNATAATGLLIEFFRTTHLY